MILKSTLALFATLFLIGIASAQTAGGGAAAGIGRTVEAAGRSAAARELQKKIGTTLVRAVAREKAAPRRASTGGRPQSARPSPVASVPIDTTAAFFKPDPRADSMAKIADELGSNPTERQQLRQIFTATKQAFEKEVAAKGRSNNLPAA
ncbi:MAG: hypothetical protein PSX80_00060, partial [bacterium]|nr:hypothetical protein [bacterium]